ncbi:hypothetical protein PTTG_01781 [Puccinia triticina 1-1 BBBD Race 1]|uniref:Uncharacterized protein n=2 Tax=Puccinia triticina TaxID=208348 RepID=A0A180H1D2_PUCT1|nr:uncharacterized protein PtA15_11A640 [Puccinia triticina]OAV98594.1 hypothetical protein PTTG_01781 [Puccinia triticina 1-1 BBBD Race 1]WAQ89948.1 hypothetical protein PtA15_11A640 [Puccinia triticina]
MICVKFTYLLAASSLLAVASAEESNAPKAEAVEEKYVYGGVSAGGLRTSYCGIGWGVPVTYNWMTGSGAVSAFTVIQRPRRWFKDIGDSALSTSRRSLSIEPENLSRRDDSNTVHCKDNIGHVDHFVVADCVKAVESLVAKKTSSAACGTCSAKLVTPQGPVAPSKAPVDELKNLAISTLQACGANKSSAPARRSPADVSVAGDQLVAMIFQKGNGQTCA